MIKQISWFIGARAGFRMTLNRNIWEFHTLHFLQYIVIQSNMWIGHCKDLSMVWWIGECFLISCQACVKTDFTSSSFSAPIDVPLNIIPFSRTSTAGLPVKLFSFYKWFIFHQETILKYKLKKIYSIKCSFIEKPTIPVVEFPFDLIIG